jgi:hypothetical protein
MEQVNMRLRANEKRVLTLAARKNKLRISEYVRGRLFDDGRLIDPLTEADKLLLDGLANLRPQLETSLAQINANLKQIAQMRQTARKLDAERPRLSDALGSKELLAIAVNLGLAAPATRVG